MSGQCIWISGAGGLIGNYLVQSAPKLPAGTTLVGLTRLQLDLTDFAAVRREFRRQLTRRSSKW